MREYEVKTMQKDIERMKKKTRASGSLSEPLTERDDSIPPQPLYKSSMKSKPPEELSKVHPISISKKEGIKSKKLPGAPLPSEPIVLTESFKTAKPFESVASSPTPELEIKETRRKKIFNRKIIIPIIVLVVILLICIGVYYWLIYSRA